MEIQITTPVPHDILGIQKVFYEAQVDAYPNEEYGITREDLEFRYKDNFSEEVLEKRKQNILDISKSEDELFLIAKASEKVVGVCYLKREEDKNNLQALYILPEFQGKGIGKKFWEKAKEFFDMSKDTSVEVVTYTKAVKFYESLGFVDTGNRFSRERFKMRNGSIMPTMEMVIKGK